MGAVGGWGWELGDGFNKFWVQPDFGGCSSQTQACNGNVVGSPNPFVGESYLLSWPFAVHGWAVAGYEQRQAISIYFCLEGEGLGFRVKP